MYGDNKNRLPYTIGESKLDLRDSVIIDGKTYNLKKFLPVVIDKTHIRLIIDLERE
jgi:hypothetical protein